MVKELCSGGTRHMHSLGKGVGKTTILRAARLLIAVRKGWINRLTDDDLQYKVRGQP